MLYNQNLCTYIKQIVRICLLQRKLGLVSFSAITGNTCCLTFLNLKIFLCIFVFQTPACIRADESFNNTWKLILGLINIFISSSYSISQYGLGLISFRIFCATSVAMGTFFSVSWTYKYFYDLLAFQTPAWIGAD